MAKVKFGDLNGVLLRRIEDESVKRDIICKCVSDEYDIVSRGDVIFEIDLESKTINRCNVKYIRKNYHGEMIIYYCDVKYYRDLKPTTETFYGREIPPHMKRVSCMYNKSVYGLLCTNMEDAMKRLAAINARKYFGALEGGDKIYIVDKESNIVREETVEELFHRDPDGDRYEKYFGIKTENYYFICCNSEFEENASHFSDKHFYVIRQNYLDCCKYSIHLEKAVADRVLREYLNSKAKTEKKKTESPKILPGTPIRHTDNKGKELHYGDVVSYVRRNGYYGHTDISFGVIVGDSEKKIKVLDEEEAKVGKKVVDWFRNNRGGFEESKGIHVLERVNVLRIKEAVKS